MQEPAGTVSRSTSSLGVGAMAAAAAAANELSPPYLLLPLPVLLLVVVLTLTLTLLARAQGRRRRRLRLPPGPWATPLIGHLHHLAGVAPPHRALRDLARRHGPLMSLRLPSAAAAPLVVVVASSPAAARAVTRTHDRAFASRPVSPALRLLRGGGGDGGEAADGLTFAPYGDAWRRTRGVCAAGLFAAPRVRALRAVREDELGRLLRSIAAAAAAAPAASPVNLTRLVSRFLFDSAARAIAAGGGGRSERRDDELLRKLREALGTLPKLSLLDFLPPPPSSCLAALAAGYVLPRVIVRRRAALRPIDPALDAVLDSIIREHLERRDGDDDAAAAAAGVQDDDEDDLLDVLLRLQKDMDSQYPFTTLNIKAVIMDLFVAGSETSATALQWAMMELMRNPATMRKAQDEVRGALAGQSKVTEDGLSSLHYLRLVIKETLRLPAPVLLRECRVACEVLGYHVPRGATVLVNAWAIGRDPAHWGGGDGGAPPPEEFVPERFELERGGGGRSREFSGVDFEYIPFGAGRRMCPGMAFGLAHVELALAALLFHFDWELPEGMVAEEMDVTEAAGITMPPRSELVLVAIPRVPVPVD